MPLDLFKITTVSLRDYLNQRFSRSMISDIQHVDYSCLVPKKDLFRTINEFLDTLPQDVEKVVEYSCFMDSDVRKYLKGNPTSDLSHLMYIQMSGLAVITFESENRIRFIN